MSEPPVFHDFGRTLRGICDEHKQDMVSVRALYINQLIESCGAEHVRIAMRSAAKNGDRQYRHVVAHSFCPESILARKLTFIAVDITTIRKGVQAMYPDLRVFAEIDTTILPSRVLVIFDWN
jgi:hypothetical protein